MAENRTRRYASAGGIVLDPTGDRVLILVLPGRAAPDGLPEARLPKGHIELDEGRAQAAIREVLEETGLSEVELVADLGHQIVEFDYQGRHVDRDESYFLMVVRGGEQSGNPEPQFLCSWLPWDEALARLSYEPEREWVRRARQARERRQP
jgi:8-oxo-dGTP pyrophosphatase MutT (NUDIX family)